MNIRNLVFFKSDGLQIPIQYTNKITFTIIGNTYTKDRNYGWREDVEGFADVDENDKIISFTVTNGGSSFGFEEEEVNSTQINYENAIRNLVEEIVINISSSETMKVYSKRLSSKDFKLNDLFDIQIGTRKISVRSDVDSDDTRVFEYYIKSISIKEDNGYFTNDTFTLFITEDDDAKIYPSSQFLGTVPMEPVSTDLVSAMTIFVLEKVTDPSTGEVSFVRPTSSTQNFRVEFPDTSDTKIIKYMDDYLAQDGKMGEYTATDYSKAYWSAYAAFNLISDNVSHAVNEPLAFTLGFSAEDEGCYQDILTLMTVDNLTNPDESLKFNTIGYLSIKNEAVGEDERYRTLFANFGIPDPKTYPNLFKDIDILEEGVDWKFINKKSKELFLSYHEIFPYVGTYKALINAVKFLGYDDVYFKEWYKYFDGETASSISYQSVDIIEGQTLSSKLKRVGVSLEEFLDWKKLNQLSLMYHINEEETSYDIIPIKDNSTGRVISQKSFAIPDTIPVYTYLNNEVLAKLYALREWLQTYIININCKIIDVTGEGIYFERYKENAYPSPVYTQFDVQREESLTPVFNTSLSDLVFKDSQARLNVTIKELMGGLRFTDLETKQISDYVMNVDSSAGNIDYEHASVNEIINSYIKGRDFSNITPFQSIKYAVSTTPTSGTLRKNVGYYSEERLIETPLYVNDNKISIFGYRTKEVELFSKPPIKIKAGRLRKCFGKWQNNIAFKIQGFFDTDRTRTRFCIQNNTGTAQEISDDYIALYPQENASLKFTENNKYNVPMFIIENYDTYDRFIERNFGGQTNKFILEIDEGFIPMDENSDNTDGITCTAELHFEQDYDVNNANAQKINIKYVYETPNIPMDSFDVSNFTLNVSELWDEYKEDTANIDKQISLLESLSLDKVKVGEIYLKDETGDFLYDMNDEALVLYAKNLSQIQTEDIILVNGEEAVLYLDIFRDGQFLQMMLEKEWNDIDFENYRKYYSDKINEIADLMDSNPSFAVLYEEEIKTWEEKLINLNNKRNNQLDDYQVKFDYLKGVWMSAYKTRKMNFTTKFVEKIETRKAANYQRNLSFNINVNHTGEYNLTVYAVDDFNMPYVMSGSKTVKVNADVPKVIISDYRNRQDCDTSVWVGRNDSNPIFIPEYPRYISKVDKSNSLIEYLDYSYYLDNPKEGDYLQVSNTSERIDDIDFECTWDASNGYQESVSALMYGSFYGAPQGTQGPPPTTTDSSAPPVPTLPPRLPQIDVIQITEDGASTKTITGTDYIKIVLNDETAGNQNPFYLGGEVYIVLIDTNSGRISSDYPDKYGPYNVMEYEPIPENDTREENENYLILGYNANRTDIKVLQLDDDIEYEIQEGNIKPHLIVTTRIEINKDNIFNDRESKTCTFKIKDKNNGSNLAFRENQIIKIVYSSMSWNGYTTLADGSQTDALAESWMSETAYRILSAYYDYSDFTQTYVIDGLINTDLLELEIYKNGVYNHISDTPSQNLYGVPFEIKCSVAPCHQSYVDYKIQSLKDGDEDNTTGRIEFTSEWFAEDYLDNTFSFRKRDFDVDKAFADWTEQTISEPVYLNGYTSPISEPPETEIHISSKDSKNVFETIGYMSIWSVYHNEYKDKTREYLKYQVVNDNLDICLHDEGEYRFKLTAVDFYGNKVDNLSDGYLKCFYGA